MAELTLDLVMAVLARDGYRCVRCGKPAQGQRGWDWSIQHRQPRGMGGTIRPGSPANAIVLCGSGTTGCHGHVESHRGESTANGWLVSRYADPAQAPCLVDRESRWTYLTDDGLYADDPPGGEP